MDNKTECIEVLDSTNIEENIDFYARLACLIDGVNIAGNTAEKLGIDVDKSDSWIKPIAFQKYVDERYGDMKYNIERYLKGEEDETYTW